MINMESVIQFLTTMNTSDKLSLIALVVSALSIIWNLISYFRYDKPLKELDIKSKKIEILKYEQEQENKKKAIIKGEFEFKGESKYYIFHVTNVGECMARNLEIGIPEGMFYLPSPIKSQELLPSGQTCSIRVSPNVNCPQSIIVSFTWDDDFAKRRNSEETLYIPNRY